MLSFRINDLPDTLVTGSLGQPLTFDSYSRLHYIQENHIHVKKSNHTGSPTYVNNEGVFTGERYESDKLIDVPRRLSTDFSL